LYSPIICKDPRFPEMMDRDLSRTTVESFLRSISSLRRTNLIPMLPQIKVPAMGMYGDKDVIVHPLQWQPMQRGIPQAVIERFPTAGHFIMLEEPTVFSQKLKSFLDQDVPAL
jgi:pimeloyl-ACP methyl ester carboxylesterase